MKEFENHVVLVTGGGSGIGYETTRQFVREGAQVIIADIRQEAIEESLNPLGKGLAGRRVMWHVPRMSLN